MVVGRFGDNVFCDVRDYFKIWFSGFIDTISICGRDVGVKSYIFVLL